MLKGMFVFTSAVLLLPCAVQAQSCSSVDKELCHNFCVKNRNMAGECFSDCRSRFAECLKTGSYYWTKTQTFTGLTKE